MLKVTVLDKKDAENCPYRDVIDRIGDKWSLLVLCVLEQQPTRFNELKRTIGDITQRVLTSTLRNLERDGYVIRTLESDRPIRVSYRLSALGKSAVQAVHHLVDWAERNHRTIVENRKKYDAVVESDRRRA